MFTIILISVLFTLVLSIITSTTKPLKNFYKFTSTNGDRTLGYNQIPGPFTFPLIGNVLGYKCPVNGRNPSKSLDIWRHLNQVYGSLVRLDIPGREPTVLVFDPHVAEQVYRNEGVYPHRPAFFSMRAAKRQEAECPATYGLLSNNGEDWKTFRKTVQAPLTKHSSMKKHLDKVTEISEEFTEHLQSIIDTNTGAVDNFNDEIYKWALESIAAISLDTRLGCFGNKTDEEHLTMIRAVQSILKLSKKLDSGLRLWELFPSADFQKFHENYKTFKTSAHKCIVNATEKDSDNDDDYKESLVSDLTKLGCSKDIVTAAAIELLFGGVDTTSHTLIFILYLLATNPDVQEKLFDEMSSITSSSEVLNHSYLKAVIKEAMRMLPVAPANIRQLSVPLSIGSKNAMYQCNAGTTYILCHQTMSTSPTWVTSPGTFMPERWIRGSHLYQEIHPFISLPFGFGPRMCIGRNLAMMEVSILVWRLLSTWKIGWRGPPLEVRSDILVFPDSSLCFTFQQRESGQFEI